MFWTDNKRKRPAIRRSAMDGTDVDTIVNTDLASPEGLAVDTTLEKIFWTDTVLKKIEFADLNGEGEMTIITLLMMIN